MSIKAFFASGLTKLTVNGLHQWDYGCKLEIHSNDLPALVEVHFACAGMDFAVVRTCSVVNGVAVAVIPDRCLEQTAPIRAWIYEVGENTGTTTKTIILPIIARTRPQTSATDPEMYSDKYTELIAAVNDQVGTLKEGNVTVAKATQATNADRAESAYMADIAAHASHAESAALANLLDARWTLINDGNAVYVSNGSGIANCKFEPTASYIICVIDDTTNASGTVLLTYESTSRSCSSKTTLNVQFDDGTRDLVDISLQYDGDILTIEAYSMFVEPGQMVTKRFKVYAAYMRIA